MQRERGIDRKRKIERVGMTLIVCMSEQGRGRDRKRKGETEREKGKG